MSKSGGTDLVTVHVAVVSKQIVVKRWVGRKATNHVGSWAWEFAH